MPLPHMPFLSMINKHLLSDPQIKNNIVVNNVEIILNSILIQDNLYLIERSDEERLSMH